MTTKQKLLLKKKEMNQKKQGKLKAASVKDLTREVKSNKKIGSRDAARTANKQFGERVNKIFNLFSSDKKTSSSSSRKNTNKGVAALKGATLRSGIKTGGSSKVNKPMSFKETAEKKKSPTATAPKTYKSGRVGTPGMGTRSGIQTGNKSMPVRGGIGPLRTGPKATPGTPGMGDRSGIKTGGKKSKTLTDAQKKAIRDTKQVTVKKGDTLTAIAKRNGTTVANLKKINPSIKDINKIKPGQKIRVGGSDASTKRIGEVSKSPTRPRTIAQAQKMGKKYFFDKNGKRKAAVTAEQLKKQVLTLAQWLKKN